MIDFCVGKGKHLKAARISKSWTMPASKFRKPAGFFDKVWAWSEDEMISVGENTLRPKFAHLSMCNSFDGSASGSTDKSRRLNIAVWRMNNAGAHQAFLFDDVELQHMNIESP